MLNVQNIICIASMTANFANSFYFISGIVHPSHNEVNYFSSLSIVILKLSFVSYWPLCSEDTVPSLDEFSRVGFLPRKVFLPCTLFPCLGQKGISVGQKPQQ